MQVHDMRSAAIAKILVLAALASTFCMPAYAADGMLKLPAFSGLEEQASESVTITLDAALLGLAGRFLNAEDPEDAAAKEVIQGLKGVYVRSFTFDSDFVYRKSDVDLVRRQLSAPGWQRLVEVRSRKQNSEVDVYLSMEGDKVRGLAIIASEPRELTIVNIVGSVDLQKLHQLEGRFGVPKLQIEEDGKRAAD
jgi:hypothetical protein